MTDPIRLVVLSAGLSTPSSTRMLADHLSGAARRQLEHTGGAVEVQTVELREYAHDITDAMLTRFPNERLAMVVASLRVADAVIAVTPVFNVGPAGLFKSFFDVVDIGIWQRKPVLLGATAGTPRHSLAIDYAIRPMFGYLKAELAPTSVFAASGDFGSDAAGQGEQDPLDARARRAAAELVTLLQVGTGAAAQDADGAEQESGEAIAVPGAGSGLDAEFSDFVPMGKLLGRD